MLNLDVWLHQQLREQLWKGSAAVSAYLSVATQLTGVTLSALFLKAPTGTKLISLFNQAVKASGIQIRTRSSSELINASK
jgi:hypothetical protein